MSLAEGWELERMTEASPPQGKRRLGVCLECLQVSLPPRLHPWVLVSESDLGI